MDLTQFTKLLLYYWIFGVFFVIRLYPTLGIVVYKACPTYTTVSLGWISKNRISE